MNNTIFTPPITEAFSQDSECPICTLQHSIESSFIKSMYDEMVMDVEFNMRLASYRCCDYHYDTLYNYPDKLGLAVLLRWTVDAEKKEAEKFYKGIPLEKANIFKSFMKDKNNTPSRDKHEKQCYICLHINERMKLHIENIIKLWDMDSSFKEQFNTSKGFCVKHYNALMDTAPKVLKGGSLDSFTSTLYSMQMENLTRLGEELDWFIRKHDYRFTKDPWKTSRDSVIRGVLKMK